MPRLPQVPLADVVVEDPATRPLGPPPSPDAYRQSNPYQPPPAEYKPPSLLAEHKGLAIIFMVVVLGFALYCWKVPHQLRRARGSRRRRQDCPARDLAVADLRRARPDKDH